MQGAGLELVQDMDHAVQTRHYPYQLSYISHATGKITIFLLYNTGQGKDVS